MPRGQLTKQEMQIILLSYKKELCEDTTWSSDPKSLAHKYLNKVLEKIQEYAR